MRAAQIDQRDLERLSKVATLMKAGATEGERDSARRRAQDMCRRLGIPLEEGLRRARPQPQTATQRDPARQARERAEAERREAQRQREERDRQWREEVDARRRGRQEEAVRRFGPEEAIFAQCNRERAIYAACEPIARREPDYDPAHPEWVSKLDGWAAGYGDVPKSVRDALSAAYPMPGALAQAWEEWRYWNKRMDARWAFDEDYGTPVAIEARMMLLKAALYEWPAATIAEAMVRADWFKAECNTENRLEGWEAERFADRVWADLEGFAQAVKDGHSPSRPPSEPQTSDPSGPVKSGQPYRSNADKRRDVLELLQSDERLSDREIARRAGVSAQTVGNIRRRSGR